MSYQRGTTHYNLPQTIGTDKRDWSDTNQAFTDVDAALYAAAQDASTAAGAVTALDTRLTTQEGKMSTAEGKIAVLEASDTTQDTAILGLQNAVNGLQHGVIAAVTADGVKTNAQLFNELFAQMGNDVDYTRFEVVQGDGAHFFLNLFEASSAIKVYGGVTEAGKNLVHTLKASGSSRIIYYPDGTQYDQSDSVPAVGVTLEIIK